MEGNPPWGGQGASPPRGGAQPPVPTNPAPQWPHQAGEIQQRRGILVPVGVIVAVLLAAAALAVALIDNGNGSSTPPPTLEPTADAVHLLDDAADRSLCLAIGPLMRESEDTRNAFQRTGAPGSPERNTALPKFVRDTHDWADRVQEVLNDHAKPPRYLVRTLQRYIDDALLYAENISADRPPSKYETQIYDLSIMDYGGPVGRCADLDAGWWD